MDSSRHPFRLVVACYFNHMVGLGPKSIGGLQSPNCFTIYHVFDHYDVLDNNSTHPRGRCKG